MNFDELLTDPFESITQKYIMALRTNFRLCGSRKVLPENELVKGTDWDFYGAHSDSAVALLETMGFYEKIIETHYADITTHSVWFVQDPKGFNYPIQVVLKKPEYVSYIDSFWRIMRDRPETFKKLFWKSYEVDGVKPNTQDTVRANINHWMEYVMPLM